VKGRPRCAGCSVPTRGRFSDDERVRRRALPGHRRPSAGPRRQVHLAPALMLGAIATGTTPGRGVPRGRDCLATLRAVASLGVNVQRPAPGRSSSKRRAARTRSPALGARHGQCRHGDAALHGPALGTGVRLRADRRRVVDAAPDGARREAAARDGRADRDAGRATAPCGSVVAPRCADCATRCRWPAPRSSPRAARGLYAEGETTVVEPAVTRDHTERMLQSFGANVVARAAARPCCQLAQLAAARISVPGDFSSAAFFIVAACIGAREPFVIESVGVNRPAPGCSRCWR